MLTVDSENKIDRCCPVAICAQIDIISENGNEQGTRLCANEFLCATVRHREVFVDVGFLSAFSSFVYCVVRSSSHSRLFISCASGCCNGNGSSSSDILEVSLKCLV